MQSTGCKCLLFFTTSSNETSRIIFRRTRHPRPGQDKAPGLAVGQMVAFNGKLNKQCLGSSQLDWSLKHGIVSGPDPSGFGFGPRSGGSNGSRDLGGTHRCGSIR